MWQAATGRQAAAHSNGKNRTNVYRGHIGTNSVQGAHQDSVQGAHRDKQCTGGTSGQTGVVANNPAVEK